MVSYTETKIRPDQSIEDIENCPDDKKLYRYGVVHFNILPSINLCRSSVVIHWKNSIEVVFIIYGLSLYF